MEGAYGDEKITLTWVLRVGSHAEPLAVDADAVIVCKLFANKPNYSGGKITATGGIKSCSPRPPDACSFEADLEFYQQDGPGPGVWVTRASSRRGNTCPPPARSKTAAGSCSPSSKTYSYRTLTSVP
ncbi:hypothetical protein [Streptomyces venezuelae]|uniref:hypothetical protein n=1 Tax=Streptomyces venezuelae TaxID=54571 RepID=UPI0037BD1277